VWDIINTAAALDADRRDPMFATDEHGNPQIAYHYDYAEYRLTPEALAGLIADNDWPADTVGAQRYIGRYEDPLLDAIQTQYREAELVQAIHRARINIHEAIVYLLTSTPTAEPLDGLWNDPPVGPPGIPFMTWREKLLPWLDSLPAGAELTYADIADYLDVSKKYVRSRQWLQSIAEYTEDWHASSIVKGRGRPTSGIRK